MLCLDYPFITAAPSMHVGKHQSVSANPEVDGLKLSDLVSAQH